MKVDRMHAIFELTTRIIYRTSQNFADNFQKGS